MIDPTHILFIHGSNSSSQTYKARLLRSLFPSMLTPDFVGSLPERLEQLENFLGVETGWRLIGSSLGGLMAALFASQNPHQVRKLILLAPALTYPEFTDSLASPISIPTVIIQGKQDDVIPLKPNRELAERLFPNLEYMLVDDDHRLEKIAGLLPWKELLL